MKKVISIVLACAMILSLVSVNVFALSPDAYSYTLTADNTADVKNGDTVNLLVTLNTTEDVSAVAVYVKYDPSLFQTAAYDYDADNEEWVDYGCIDEDWWDDFSSIRAAKSISNGGFNFVQNNTAGVFGVIYQKKNAAAVTAANAEEMDVLCINLTAIADIPDGTVVELWNRAAGNAGQSYVTALVEGRSTTCPINDSVTFTASSAPVVTATPTVAPTATPTVAPTATPTVAPTATPTVAPTATPTAAPTAAPIVTNTNIAEELNVSAPVAEKAFTVMAKLENIEGQTVQEFGIRFLASDDNIDMDTVIANGTNFKALGKLDDGSYGVKLINGDSKSGKDNFGTNNVGIVTYMKIAGEYIWGAFQKIK